MAARRSKLDEHRGLILHWISMDVTKARMAQNLSVDRVTLWAWLKKNVGEGEIGMDYEIIARCEFEVRDRSDPNGYSACRAPATYSVWWNTRGYREPVCSEHFELMRKNEGIL